MRKQKRDIEKCSYRNETYIFRKLEKFANLIVTPPTSNSSRDTVFLLPETREKPTINHGRYCHKEISGPKFGLVVDLESIHTDKTDVHEYKLDKETNYDQFTHLN